MFELPLAATLSDQGDKLLFVYQAPTRSATWNDRCWLKADLPRPEFEVCFTPNNGHSETPAGLPVLTQSGHRVRNKARWLLLPWRHLWGRF